MKSTVPSTKLSLSRGTRLAVTAVFASLSVLGFVGCATPATDVTNAVDTARAATESSSRPNFTGNYDIATLTPLQRPEEFGNNLFLSQEQANAIVSETQRRADEGSKNRGPVTDAPPAGGAAPVGASAEELEASGAGSVGGYNYFWVDPGTDVFMLDGKFRTSIITDPANGRWPELTDPTKQTLAQRAYLRRPNDGTAWWVDLDKPGPYDGPESLGDSERCIIGFGSTAGPPMLPVLYNNLKRIVQTPTHVTILIEMVHDARIIRLNSEHAPADIRSRMGDSIGWWEADTLVVDTTNFSGDPAMYLASENLHVVERFKRVNDNDILYSFTVEDSDVWTAPWSGEYLWPASENRVYEYACHEGNYSMPGILKGARLLEIEAQAGAAGGED